MGFVRSEINIWINRTTTKDASSTLRIINQSIRRRLKIDRKNRVHQVGEDVELLMTQGNIKESWGGGICRWYTQSTGGHTQGTQPDLQRITE